MFQRVRKAARPAEDWGPALDKFRQEYLIKLKSLSMQSSTDSSESDNMV